MTADPTRDTGSEPRTEAGRRLRDLSMGLMVNGQRFDALILAIEADARADLLTELRAAVEGLATTRSVPLKALPTGPQDWDSLISRRAVLDRLAAAPLAEQGDGLDVAVRRLLDTVSAAEALGWNWYDGMKRVKALHPISGDLMSAHANLALAATPSRPAEES